MTLASILIKAGRAGERVPVADVCERLQLSDEELREDVNVLNVVNFGGGSYVLYAEINEEEGEIEVDPEPYSDNFDRPARLLPVEAKALVAAIDLIGEHIPEGSLTSAREKIVAALGEDPMEQGLQVAPAAGDDSDVARLVSKAIVERRMVELEYYKENEDELSLRRVEPYALTNGREGWYVASFDPERDGVRHFRLDRIKRATVTEESFEPRPEVDPAAEVDGWLRTGEVEASRTARVWVSPERARWAREARRVVEERSDGSVVVELSFAGVDWLVREILREAGDAAVLEPQDAREAVREAIARLGDAQGKPARRRPKDRRASCSPPRRERRVSRREQIKMSDEEVADFLAEERTVTCATIGPRGWPHLMPLWYVLRDATAGEAGPRLWAWTYAASQKVRNLERDPRATLQVETGEEYAGAARRDARVRGRASTARSRRSWRWATRSSTRYAVPRGAPRRVSFRRLRRDGRRAGRQARGAGVRRAPPRQLGSPQARRRLLSRVRAARCAGRLLPATAPR